MKPAPRENAPVETGDLRRTMRDLVRLSGLSTVWSTQDLGGIVRGLADVVSESLALTFAYARFPGRPDGPIEIISSRESAQNIDINSIQQALNPILSRQPPQSASIQNPIGQGRLNLGIVRCGISETAGYLVAASDRPGFPQEQESLLLSVAANQAALAIERQGASQVEAHLAAIVESSEDAIVGKTLDGIITSWNSGAERLFGYTADEVRGRSILILIPAERHAEEVLILSKLRAGERIDHYETVRLRKDGSLVDVSLTVSPIRDAAGHLVGASKIARDITDRRRMDEAQAQALQNERDARLEAQILVELARELGGELQLQKLVQTATDAATRLTNAEFGAFFYNITDEAGESYLLYTLSGMPREAFEKFGLPRNTPLFGATFRGEGVVRVDDVLQDPRYGQNPPFSGMPEGHLPVRSYLAVPVLSRRGEVLGGLFFGHSQAGIFTEATERVVQGVAAQAGVCIDSAQLYDAANREIEERRLAEERERAARTQAERATRLRDEFLATLSHELRTPLNGILGWTQLLRRFPDDPDTRESALDAIERGTRVQARLIEDLLDMSRIISGKLRIDVQTVELVSIIEAAIETMRPAAEAKQIRIQRMLDPHAGPIKGDAARLQQVLWNFLSNAVKFTPRSGLVQINLERVNSHVEICVSDNGCGIAPEYLPHVFDRFSQADSSTTRRYGGLGLGLAVAKHIVELHGGKVWAKSAGEGTGSTFTVHLPIAIVRQDSTERAHPLITSGRDSLPNDIRLTKISVLVVDDDPDSRELLRRILTENEAEVVVADSGSEAIGLLDKRSVHVVVSDVGMPEMDGYQFIRTLRERGIRTPAVALTAFARPEDRIRALRAGYNMHISKPLEPMELIEVVASLARSGAAH